MSMTEFEKKSLAATKHIQRMHISGLKKQNEIIRQNDQLLSAADPSYRPNREATNNGLLSASLSPLVVASIFGQKRAKHIAMFWFVCATFILWRIAGFMSNSIWPGSTGFMAWANVSMIISIFCMAWLLATLKFYEGRGASVARFFTWFFCVIQFVMFLFPGIFALIFGAAVYNKYYDANLGD